MKSSEEMEQEVSPEQEQAMIAWRQKIAEQKRVLKSYSRNKLIRIIVDMSVRAFYQQWELQELKGKLDEKTSTNTD